MKPIPLTLKGILDKYTIKGTEESCWLWTGQLTVYGIPTVMYKKTISVRKFVYEQMYGRVKSHATFINTCDNKKCVNPKHIKIKKPPTEEEKLKRQKKYNKKYKKQDPEGWKNRQKEYENYRTAEENFSNETIECLHTSDDMHYKLYRVKHVNNVVLKKSEYHQNRIRRNGKPGDDFDIKDSKPFACFIFLDQARMFGDMLYPENYIIFDTSPEPRKKRVMNPYEKLALAIEKLD